MTLREKYPQLQDPAFVRRMIVDAVYGTMALEDQEVSKERLEEIYDEVQREKAARNIGSES